MIPRACSDSDPTGTLTAITAGSTICPSVMANTLSNLASNTTGIRNRRMQDRVTKEPSLSTTQVRLQRERREKETPRQKRGTSFDETSHRFLKKNTIFMQRNSHTNR